MQLKPGLRLGSQVCSTEVIIVRASTEDIDLRCGGAPMVPLGTPIAEGATPAEGFDIGNGLGKRYTTNDPEGLLEVLVTKQGGGALSIYQTLLALKEAKPIPSSD